MFAGVAEHLSQQFGGAVDHFGLAGEAGGAVDEADDLDHLFDPVQTAEGGLQRCQTIDRADSGRFIAGLFIDRAAYFSLKRQFAVDGGIWPEV